MAQYSIGGKTQQAAPYVRKKLGKRSLAYQPTSVIPGVKHVIEGRKNLYNVIREGGGGSQIGKHPGLISPTSVGSSNKREVKKQIDQYGAEDLARSKLRTIEDPDQDRSIERKRAARRRMRGRLGTLLSERESLG